MIRHSTTALLIVLLAACAPAPSTPAAAQESRPDPLPGTKLSIEQLKALMFHVSAGKRLKPVWPNGARVAVGLSFDVDNATATLSTGTIDFELLSRGDPWVFVQRPLSLTFLVLAGLLLLFVIIPNVRKARETAFSEAN